ncbi:MAG TPA: dephospho-CoA kinase [Vicinamibacterales bacterium]|nr:dephospho-CoA kinase [Vicinamibacterales bacterium]
MRRVALTGGIATGKSHVRSQFEKLGVPTIDADTLAREAIAPGTRGLDNVVRRFGSEVCDAAGVLNRKKLGAIVFANPQARRDLEHIIHPYVREAMDRWFASLDAARCPVGVADIPLLFETGREKEFDAVVVTACAAAAQLDRLMKRDGLTKDEAAQRIAAQWPLDGKVAKADYVIRTDGTFDDTNRQVNDVVRQLQSRSATDAIRND